MRDSESRTFSKKIQLIVERLECGTLAGLIARIQAVNPRSPVTLDRMYKWAQGRTLPRGYGVYDDLARVLGLPGEGAFVRTSPLDASCFANSVSTATFEAMQSAVSASLPDLRRLMQVKAQLQCLCHAS